MTTVDAGTASIIATSIATMGTIVIAIIGAIRDSGRAVARATGPLDREISRLRELVITLNGDPDEH